MKMHRDGLDRRFVLSARGALFAIEERTAPRGRWKHVRFGVTKALQGVVTQHREEGWVAK